MKKSVSIVSGFILILLLSTSVHAQGKADRIKEVENQLKSTFPNTQVEAVSESPIPELYEVVLSSGQILYWSPKGYLIFGEMWTKDGKSITAERRYQLRAERIKDLPLEKAVKVGKGSKRVITFSDPLCPFCKRGFDYMSKRTDVTEYVFLLPYHQGSAERISYILCAEDREKAYVEVMTNPKKEVKVSEECREKTRPLIDLYTETATRMGVTGTPTYVINGQIIPGINVQAIENALGGSGK